MNNEVKQSVRPGISGSTLKLIAIITMFIDHVGAVIVERMVLKGVSFGSMSLKDLYLLDQVLRSIGRIGFPIFCFLLVEGFIHTRNRVKYGLRLALFAFLSEIPFDLAFTGKVFSTKCQNVFFTLLIGLLVMAVFRVIEEKYNEKHILAIVLMLLSLAAGMTLTVILKTDYDYRGVISIVILYIFRMYRPLQLLAGALTFMWEIPAPAAFFAAACYNGRRGLKLKYVFYIFYPLHLLLLYFIAVNLGIA